MLVPMQDRARACARVGVTRSGLLLAFVAALGIGVVAVAACGSFGATETGGDAAPGEASPPDGASSGDGGTCEPGAFCDFFDDDAGLPRKWTDIKQTGNSSLNLVPGVGLNGSGALVATFVPDGKPQASRLLLVFPMQGPEVYEAVIAFSAQANIATDGVVLGPRFVVDGADGLARGISVTFKKGLVRLDPDTCDAGDCILPKDEIPIAGGWHRYVLTLGVRPAGIVASSYELDIDGTVAIPPKGLPLMLSRPASYGLGFGVTYSGGVAAGTILFDDVSFRVTPR